MQKNHIFKFYTNTIQMTVAPEWTDYQKNIYYHEAGHFYTALLFNHLNKKFPEPSHYNIKFDKDGICEVGEVVVKPEFRFKCKQIDFEQFDIDTNEQVYFSSQSMGFHLAGCVTHRVFWNGEEDENYRLEDYGQNSAKPHDHDFYKFNYCCKSISIYGTGQRLCLLKLISNDLYNLFTSKDMKNILEKIATMMWQKESSSKIRDIVLGEIDQNNPYNRVKPLIAEWEAKAKMLAAGN